MFPLLHSDFPVIRVPSNALDMVYEPMSWLEPGIKSMLMRYLTVCPSTLYICYTSFIRGSMLSWTHMKLKSRVSHIVTEYLCLLIACFVFSPFILVLSMTTGGSNSWPSVDMPRCQSAIFLRITLHL